MAKIARKNCQKLPVFVVFEQFYSMVLLLKALPSFYFSLVVFSRFALALSSWALSLSQSVQVQRCVSRDVRQSSSIAITSLSLIATMTSSNSGNPKKTIDRIFTLHFRPSRQLTRSNAVVVPKTPEQHLDLPTMLQKTVTHIAFQNLNEIRAKT